MPQFERATIEWLPLGTSGKALSYSGGRVRAAQWYREHVALAARGDRGEENARGRAYYADHREGIMAKQRAHYHGLTPEARKALLERNNRRRSQLRREERAMVKQMGEGEA